MGSQKSSGEHPGLRFRKPTKVAKWWTPATTRFDELTDCKVFSCGLVSR
jgi:hypothetical protein